MLLTLKGNLLISWLDVILKSDHYRASTISLNSILKNVSFIVKEERKAKNKVLMFIYFVWSLYCIWYEVKSKMRSVAFSCLNIKDNCSLPSIKNTNELNSRKKKKNQWISFCFPFLKDRNSPRPIWNSLTPLIISLWSNKLDSWHHL